MRHLTEADQNLLHLALSGRHTYRQVASLRNRSPGAINRRVHQLLRRLSHPLVIDLIENPAALCDRYQRIGLEHFLHGQSVNSLAEAHQVSRREIRSILAMLNRWAKKIHRAGIGNLCAYEREGRLGLWARAQSKI
jgi:DNA-directed RNA polymerase specialized sigma24 family protein